MKALTVKLTVDCSHCALPVPLNGPPHPLRCNHCSKETWLGRWPEILVDAHDSATRPLYIAGSEKYSIVRAHEQGPVCAGCGRTFQRSDLVLHASGLHTRLDCVECKQPLYGYAAPGWLRQELPTVEYVFTGDADFVTNEQGRPAEQEQPEPKPIAMACPQCAGGLMVTAAAERVVECGYCKTSVFLPEELWRRMHPVKTLREWTLLYTDRVRTAQQMREEAAERAQQEQAELEAQQRVAARQARFAEEAYAREREQEAARVAQEARRRRARHYLLGALCIGVAAMVIARFLLR